MKKGKIIGLLVMLLGITSLMAQDLTEWRGPNRTGVFDETNLLKQWPEGGPDLLWSTEELPMGWSSMTVAHNQIYLSGRIDSVDVAVALSMDGSLLWQTAYGRSWDKSFPESRCTPTVDGERLYLSSGSGDLACINALTGEIIWASKTHELYKGSFGRWGISESLLVVDDKVFFTPGGDSTTMLALNKMTGETIWASESLNDKPSYVSPLLVQHGNQQLIVNVSERFIFGISPFDGQILWQFNFEPYKDDEVKANINTNTPLYHNGEVFVSSGYNHAAVMLSMAEDAHSVSLKYVDTILDTHHGGLVRLGEYIYASNWEHNRMGRWVCLEWNSGILMYEAEWNNKGPIIAADGMLYCYEEKTGNVALVKAGAAQFEMTGTFELPLGDGFHWSHPIIHNKILYIRHGNALMAYDIAEKQ